jgi:hypothetical protein
MKRIQDAIPAKEFESYRSTIMNSQSRETEGDLSLMDAFSPEKMEEASNFEFENTSEKSSKKLEFSSGKL